MKDEIKVGEYIRTYAGIIDKVDSLYEKIDNTIHLENQKWFDTKNIKKHSSNIIDLIEQGDYVNGIKTFLIEKAIGYGDKGQEGILINKIYTNCKFIPKDDIKSIVTKEQFKSVEYEVSL